jgi:hypothetical protein
MARIGEAFQIGKMVSRQTARRRRGRQPGNGRLANAAGLGGLDLDRAERRSSSELRIMGAGSRDLEDGLRSPDVDEKRASMARRAARPPPFVGSLFPIES